ncbi:hypothetical protein PROFUN_15109 [Planoprotostelium fungivorum]|uniref:peptidylprolyl isomerase n=1 Tax=Planoprotostelium fungivorum TaxID=1890364 RepID=A0A2P6MZ89_9EUKA|nr:hypothetical protein PROFUN_15109 [Planoprotostelium fungivorum]
MGEEDHRKPLNNEAPPTGFTGLRIRFQQVFVQYGRLALMIHFFGSILTFALFFLLISLGIDIQKLINKMGMSSNSESSGAGAKLLVGFKRRQSLFTKSYKTQVIRAALWNGLHDLLKFSARRPCKKTIVTAEAGIEELSVGGVEHSFRSQRVMQPTVLFNINGIILATILRQYFDCTREEAKTVWQTLRQVSSVWKRLADQTFPFWKEIEAYNEMDKKFSTTDNLKLFINLRAAFSQLTDGDNYPPEEYRLPTETSWDAAPYCDELRNSNDGVTALDGITSGRFNATLREDNVINEDRLGFVLRCPRWVRPTLDALFGEDKRLYEVDVRRLSTSTSDMLQRATLLGYSCSLHSAVINHDHNGVGYMFYPLDDQPHPTGNFHIIMPHYEVSFDLLYAYNHCSPGDYGPVIYWCTMLVCQKGDLSEMSSGVTWPDPLLTRGMSVHAVLSEYVRCQNVFAHPEYTRVPHKEGRRLGYAKSDGGGFNAEYVDDVPEDLDRFGLLINYNAQDDKEIRLLIEDGWVAAAPQLVLLREKDKTYLTVEEHTHIRDTTPCQKVNREEEEEGIRFYAIDEEEAERPLWRCCECGTHTSYTMCCHMIMFTRAEKGSTEESENHSDGDADGDTDDHSEEEQSEEDEDSLIEDLSKLRVVDLRAELKKRKQPVGGSKAELSLSLPYLATIVHSSISLRSALVCSEINHTSIHFTRIHFHFCDRVDQIIETTRNSSGEQHHKDAIAMAYKLIGNIHSIDYQRSKAAFTAQGLRIQYEIEEFLPFSWDSYKEQNEKVPASAEFVAFIPKRGHTSSVIEFISWMKSEFGYTDVRPEPLYQAIANTALKHYIEQSGDAFVYFDVNVGDEAPERLVLQLYKQTLPKTCDNFIAIATAQNPELSYVGSVIHRVVPNGWIQGGDVLGGGGDAGASIYGSHFADENFIVKHDKAGVLGMANKGPHTNSSQFYITFKPTPWMDTNYVAFGQLVDGHHLLKRIENVESMNQRPIAPVKISASGLLQVSQWPKRRGR